MPKRPANAPSKRVTNADLADKISGLRTEIVPRLERIEGLADKAGLNGFGVDIHDYFKERAETASAKQWLNRKLRPVARIRVLVAVVGFASALAWAVLGALQVAHVIHPH